jgi:indolepyruvate ferredoxin oxidoreductase beta subunit
LFAKTPLPNKKSLNIALLGALSHHLTVPAEVWTAAIVAAFPEKLQTLNLEAFNTGLNAVK